MLTVAVVLSLEASALPILYVVGDGISELFDFMCTSDSAPDGQSLNVQANTSLTVAEVLKMNLFRDPESSS